jgi:type VII secretion integral membrane protein EccD
VQQPPGGGVKGVGGVGGVRRLSIQSDSVRADLVLSAAAPIGSLLPSIVDILAGDGGYHAGPVATRYQLSLPGGAALDPSKPLTSFKIRDGATLILTSSTTVLLAPRLDDAAEAIASSVASAELHWNPPGARLVGLLVATWLAGLSAAVMIRNLFDPNGDRGHGDVGVVATIGLLSLLAAVIAYRLFREPSAGLALGLLGTGFTALAGLVAVPGGPGALNALFATAAAATSAGAMRVMGYHATVFTALAGVAASGTVAALVSAVTAAPLATIGAVSAAISLALVEVSAPVSIMLAKLRPPPATAPDGQLPNSDRLNASALRAHSWLTSLIAAFSSSAALGAIGAAVGPYLTSGPRMPGIAFAAVTGGVLLLRARAHCDIARSVPLIICGTTVLSAALVDSAASYPSRTAHIAAVSMLLAACALCFGFTIYSTPLSPVARRSVELLECFALASVVPLACWICGLYGAARGVNLQ